MKINFVSVVPLILMLTIAISLLFLILIIYQKSTYEILKDSIKLNEDRLTFKVLDTNEGNIYTFEHRLEMNRDSCESEIKVLDINNLDLKINSNPVQMQMGRVEASCFEKDYSIKYQITFGEMDIEFFRDKTFQFTINL